MMNSFASKNSVFSFPHPRMTISPLPPHSSHAPHVPSHAFASTAKIGNSSTQRRPNDVFVGDLSYFCREKDLLELFTQYGQVISCHIVYNDQRTRSLMYGFVTMSTEAEARSVSATLNNQVFMGRCIKVEMLNEYKSRKEAQQSLLKTPSYLNGHQIHVTFVSSFPADQVLTVPTEVFLRKIFCVFGTINDIIIRDYTVYPGRHKQEGFGFITYANHEAAFNAARECATLECNKVFLRCKQSVYIAKPPKGMRQSSSPPSVAFPTDMMSNYARVPDVVTQQQFRPPSLDIPSYTTRLPSHDQHASFSSPHVAYSNPEIPVISSARYEGVAGAHYQHYNQHHGGIAPFSSRPPAPTYQPPRPSVSSSMLQAGLYPEQRRSLSPAPHRASSFSSDSSGSFRGSYDEQMLSDGGLGHQQKINVFSSLSSASLNGHSTDADHDYCVSNPSFHPQELFSRPF